MARIGCLSYSGVGHVFPMASLGAELQRRGHSVVYFQRPDLRSRIESVGVVFEGYGEAEMPVGSLIRELEEISSMAGPEAFARILEELFRESAAMFREVPDKARRHGVDLFLIDQVCDAGVVVAKLMEVPYVSLALALPREVEPGVPGWCSPLPYSQEPEMLAKHAVDLEAMLAMSAPLLENVNRLLASQGRAPFASFWDAHSQLAIISQLPACFDFPRKALPPQFHPTGPFHNGAAAAEIPFPWDRLDGRPLVFASLGTLQNRLPQVFQCIAAAMAELPVQLVLSLGGGLSVEELGPLPGDPLVVPYAPQRKLLERAALMITHAGMNSALDCIAQGVPMVAIPISHDQPNIAQRIVYHGCGEMVLLDQLTPETLARAVRQVLDDSRYRERARALSAEIRQLKGLERAANIVERVIETKAPVFRETAALGGTQ